MFTKEIIQRAINNVHNKQKEGIATINRFSCKNMTELQVEEKLEQYMDHYNILLQDLVTEGWSFDTMISKCKLPDGSLEPIYCTIVIMSP